MPPSFSIIVPVFNTAEFLRECLDSVLAQTFASWECICVDDGSSDGSLAILQSYARRDARFRVFTQSNQGVSTARNRALAEAAGEYVCFLDSDDIVQSGWLANVREAILAHPGVDWVRTWYLDLLPDGARRLYPEVLRYRASFADGDGLHRLLWHSQIYCSGAWLSFFRRERFAGLRFNESLPWGEDTLFALCAIARTKSFCQIESTDYLYRAREGSAWRKTVASSALETFLVCAIAAWQAAPGDTRDFTSLVVRHVLCAASRASAMPARDLRRLSAIVDEARAAGAFDWSCLATAERIRWRIYLSTGWHRVFSFSRQGLARLARRIFRVREAGYSEDERMLLDASVSPLAQIVCGAYLSVREAVRRLSVALRLKAPRAVVPDGATGLAAAKSGLRVLFALSDNDASSGAFLCMVELAVQLRERHGVEPFAVLPYAGDGARLLDAAKIAYTCVPSSDWTIGLDNENPRHLKTAYRILFASRHNRRAIARIARLIREKEIDLVDVNTSWGYVGAIAARLAGVPHVWHIREFLEEAQHRTIWSRPAGYSILARADATIAVSQAVRRKYASVVPAGRLSMVYDGADIARFYRPERAILAGTVVTFIAVGGICRQKGQLDLVRACEMLFAEGRRNFRVMFLGGEASDERRLCDEIIRRAGMDGIFEFLGRHPNPEDYLARADIAFTCSRAEAFGRVTVEYMLSGCLAIGCASGGTTELIRDGETGYLYEPGESAAGNLAAKIRVALDSPDESRRIAAAGRKLMAGSMTLPRSVDAIHEIYRSVLRTRGGVR